VDRRWLDNTTIFFEDTTAASHWVMLQAWTKVILPLNALWEHRSAAEPCPTS